MADHYQIPFLLIHHQRKAGAEDVFDTISGTFGLTGAADSILVMDRRLQYMELHITGRDIEEARYALEFDKEMLTWILLGKADEIQSSNAKQTVFDVLKEAEGKVLTPKEIHELSGLKRNYVDKALKPLQQEGKISRAGWGKYTLSKLGV